MSDASLVYCSNHPQNETTLRCNRCEKPICPKCALHTPTGYRCQECVRRQQKTFETTLWFDYPLTMFLAGGLSLLGSRFVPAMGFFTILIAPIAGVIIAEAARFIIQRRRSRRLYKLIAAAVALGSLPYLLLDISVAIAWFLQGGAGIVNLILPLVWQGLYTFSVTSTVYYRFAGIKISA